MESQTITLFPRYTSLVGSAGGITYYSDSYDVSGFKDIRAQVFAEVISNSGTASSGIEDSSDLLTWTGTGTSVPLFAGTMLNLSKTDPARYVRVKITVTTANAVGTFWAKGVVRAA